MTWQRRRHDAVGRGNDPVDDPGDAVAAPRARRRARVGGAAAVALALAAGCTPLLDTGFGDGTGAVVIDDPDEVSADEPADVIVQPDGKIVVLFSTRVVSQSLTLVRLDADGSLDPTFGDGGRLDTGLNGGAACADLEVQPDGRYLVSSYLHSGWAAGVTRYNPDGTLDTTFGVGGMTPGGPGAPRQACELALQPDGGILAAVDSNIAGIRLVRWTPDGNVDTGFGTEGYAEIRVPGAPTIRQWSSALAVLPDGSIVAAGGATAANEPARYVVAARFGADGSLDTTFGNQGGLIDDLGGTAADMVVRPDGRILVTGTVEHRYSSNGEAQMFLAQYGSTGARDTTFGNRGVAHAVDDGWAKGVTLLEDGKVLVVGGEYPDINGPDPHDGFILLRYLADGSLDDEFGQHGISTTDRVDGAESAVAAAEQADGRLVVVGTVPHPGRSEPDVGIYRFRV